MHSANFKASPGEWRALRRGDTVNRVYRHASRPDVRVSVDIKMAWHTIYFRRADQDGYDWHPTATAALLALTHAR